MTKNEVQEDRKVIVFTGVKLADGTILHFYPQEWKFKRATNW